MNSQIDSKWYSIIELHSGEKGICCYDRIEALKVAHKLNKKYPKREVRYMCCLVFAACIFTVLWLLYY